MTIHSQDLSQLAIDQLKTQQLFGFPVLACTMEQMVALVERAIERRVTLNLGQLSGPTLVRVQRDFALRRSFTAANVYFADGAGVVLASRLLGRPLPERVAGIDLMHQLMQRAHHQGYRVFLLGAEPAILDRVVERFSRDYPGAVLAGHHHGYFTPEEEPAIARAIRDSRADILLVAITTPKKENFIARWGPEMGVPILHGVGGSFDVVAGKVKRAPRLMQRLSLEWFYRIIQEPRRMWRREGLANVLFVGLVAWELAADILKPEG